MEPNEMTGDQMMDETQTQKIDEQVDEQDKVRFMGSTDDIVKYQNFWCRVKFLNTIQHFQSHFKARDSDIILASIPKSGTTWLKSLLFTIVNRSNPDHQPLKKKSPLLCHNPHELVTILDFGFFDQQQLQYLPSPRLLQTHLPYPCLPESIANSSSCKIVYIARNPFDTFVSQWHWHTKLIKDLGRGDPELQPPSVEDFFDDFCLGKFPFGPYFDHVAEFWRQSLRQPEKVLFLKYEDLKGDHAVLHLKKLAEFVGFPFSAQEESEDVVDDTMELCSINNLRELEVNKCGYWNKLVENKNFFRKGQVGDWTNYFTPSMVERLNLLIKHHFEGTGLSFSMH